MLYSFQHLSSRIDKIATVGLTENTSEPQGVAGSQSSVSSARPMTANIHMMGSEDVKIRAKSSYAKVLEDLGFPVQLSTSAVSILISISLVHCSAIKLAKYRHGIDTVEWHQLM